MSHCAQLCECGGVCKDEHSKEAARSSAPPFHSAQPTSWEVCRPLRSWFTVTRAVVDFHSRSINFPGPCSGLSLHFVSFVTALGINLIQTLIMFKALAAQSSLAFFQKLLYCFHNSMEQALKQPNSLTQTTAPGLS